jgi:hypothetical protein
MQPPPRVEGGVLPTDTVYGIGTSPGVEGATERLFEAKVRSRDIALPVLVRAVTDAERLAQVDDGGDPGGGLLAGRAHDRAPESRGELVGPRRRSGHDRPRVPAHPLTAAVLAGSGPWR